MCERQQLYDVDKQLNDESVVVEFGTFLGSSLACMLEGYGSRNISPENSLGPTFISYDGFKCTKGSDLYRYVLSYCNSAGIEDKLEVNQDIVSWKNAAINVVKTSNCSLPVRVMIKEELINDSFSLPGSLNAINFLHLDMPKDWKVLRPILISCAPFLSKNGVIAIQDYGFELSGELILAFNKLCDWGKLKSMRAFASTVYFQVCDKISSNDLIQIDLLLNSNSSSYVEDVLKFSEIFSSIKGSRNQEKNAVSLAAIELLAKANLSEEKKINLISEQLKIIFDGSSDPYAYARLARIFSNSMATNAPLA